MRPSSLSRWRRSPRAWQVRFCPFWTPTGWDALHDRGVVIFHPRGRGRGHDVSPIVFGRLLTFHTGLRESLEVLRDMDGQQQRLETIQKAQQRLETLLDAAGEGRGDDVGFLDRWGYDPEQRQAIAGAIEAVAEAGGFWTSNQGNPSRSMTSPH